MAEPWVKRSLDQERVCLAPGWSDPDLPSVNPRRLQLKLSLLGRRSGISFFVTFTREEDSGMNGAVVAGQQLDAYINQRYFPYSTYAVLAVVRSKRKNAQTGQYVYSAGLRVGPYLRRRGMSDAELARILREAGHWLIWDNPDPSPFDFVSEVVSELASV